MDENALICRVQGGDIEAFNDLMSLHVRRVRGFIALRLPVIHLVDEIAHETFVFAFRNIQDFQPGTSFSSWLTAIASNLVRAEIQRFKREQCNQQKYADLRVFEILDRRSHDEVSSEIDLLERCLQRLPANLRSLVDFKYRLSSSTEEIASAFRQSAAWVRTTLFRLRQQLRKCVSARLETHA